MTVLTINSFPPIEIDDYQEFEYGLVVFYGKSSYDWVKNLFIPFYKDHLDEEDSFDYSIEEKNYHGRFGQLAYDKSGNFRFFITTKPIEDDGFAGWISYEDLGYQNALKNVEELHTKLNSLIKILVGKGLITEDELSILGDDFSLNEDLDMIHRVTDLPTFLEDTKGTIQDLRNED
ncbi:hypothetical protein [Enterococcus thailandicus]|uniref:hypothetical protein n=1 Tax=Enterococcus thailandicus TaxID=417368 RepID=UPI00288D7D75|nr:hypothetical protein [Enterococcus thailandicus]MDT2752347.1 hypothetical protein [Enterococcus thailandicus]MDT2776842.1 hypothetical protein [Enterococcus thailandicus]